MCGVLACSARLKAIATMVRAIREKGRLRTSGEVGLCVGSENDRQIKQPRPRANKIAVYLRDRGASDPELIRDGEHDGWAFEKRCERRPED